MYSKRLLVLLSALLTLPGLGRSGAQPAPNPALPAYTPDRTISGVIRLSGSALNGLVPLWEAAFQRLQPGISFTSDLRSGDAAIGALEAGTADLAPNGREPVLTEFLSFSEVFSNDGPFQVTVGTGAYEHLGRTWAEVIFVNRANPLAQLTLAQLDGIFGAERTGRYDGYKWVRDASHTPADNLRTWDQLGLSGPNWSGKPIQTYGYAPTGMSNFFELVVFHGGTKWNGNLRQYVETSAKQATFHDGTTDRMMTDLEHDPYGIAWAGIAHAASHPNVKVLAIARSEGSSFTLPTPATVSDRTYPLTRSIFFQLNRPPGAAIKPRFKQFLLFILSREGQGILAAQGEYLPLTLQELQLQRHRLE